MPRKPNKAELKFTKTLEAQGKIWVYEPRRFELSQKCKKLNRNVTYTPDFYCPEDDTYYEIVGSGPAYHNNKWKILLFQKTYSHLKFKIITLYTNKGAFNLRDLDEQVHREIKAIAALEGKSLQDLLVELIKGKIKAKQ